ncbi:uncharacterized protein LOC108036544 isoform X5 [Drosophila biarmipes]|uniref:uncharacterized protein LOC108036544 isoform X5 n=1 Tax=Drosophila biarmipes TaxID=125945 RepID=UPI001CDAEB49|nr:uncharacterized protein LOC108036544 isoform X5 [Drosophila biarmipes]
MTDFNASGAMLPLDEYYEHCVVPKPKVPPRYSTKPIPKRTNRQAGRLRSYKDAGQDDEDEDEDDDFQSSELESNFQEDNDNISQMNFEMNDFNKMYWEEESLHPELSQSSAQWRTHGNNVNQPAGAAPLAPNDQARGHVKSRLDLREGSRAWNANNQRRHQNNFHRRQQNGQEQRLRTAYNAFSSQTNHAQYPGDVLTNIHNYFQSPQQGAGDLIGTHYYDSLVTPVPQDSSSIISLIDSVSHIPDNRVRNRLGCETISHAPNAFNPFPEPSPVPTMADLDGDNISKMAHNVLLLLKSAAQKTHGSSF